MMVDIRPSIHVTSVHNPLVQEVRRALATGKPLPNGLVVLEGPHLLQEALRSGLRPRQVLTTGAGAERFQAELAAAGTEIITTPARLFQRISAVESAQGLISLVRLPSWSWQQLFIPGCLLLVLDAIQDPGNAGTMVRSAEAFGATSVLFLESSVRLSNPKFLRASAGSAFRLPILEQVSTADFLERAQAAGVALYALAGAGTQSLRETDFRQASALIVGNEGSGISLVLLRASHPISIPTQGVESLNAAVACSLALYEAHNQRTGT